MLWLSTEGQYYDIEGDTLFSKEDMNRELPSSVIHTQGGDESRIKKNDFLTSNMTSGFTTIQCRNNKDFYYLLYEICRRSVLCAEMYYLDQSSSSSTIPKVNFRKFVYQITLNQLFIIEPRDSHHTELFLLQDNMPLEWIPRYVIRLDGSPDTPLCSDSFNITSDTFMPFLHSTLYLLHAYKYYVVNDYRCTHYNEWLVLDANNKPMCLCKHGKSCDTESNYRILIVTLTLIMIGFVAIWIVSFYINTVKLIDKISLARKIV